MKNVLLFPIIIGLFIFGCSGDNSSKMDFQRPNIILINVDDLGYMDTELYGNTDFFTPSILHLAASGMTFTNAYASAANCAPSRASLLSGMYNPRHGIYTVGSSERGKSRDRKIIPTANTTSLADSIVTLAEELQFAGYSTISIGKWHIGKDPTTQGFDQNIGGTHRGHPPTYFSPYQNPKLSDGPDGEYLTDRLTTETIKVIENSNAPFFLYLPYFAVHTPLQGKEKLLKKYLNRGFTPKTANYGAMVETMDMNIGRILDALDHLELRKNTVVIFTSDNGGITAVHSQSPLRAGKGSYYEGGTKVPLIVSWPGKIEEGSQSGLPVINIDFYPTILSLAKAGRTGKGPLDGVDFLPELLGEELNPGRSLFWHFPVYLQAYDGPGDDARDTLFRTRPGSTLLKGKWKLHHYFEDDEYELYDLSVDPGERNNLVQSKEDISRELVKELNNWRNSTGASVPMEPNPDYVEN